jgi:hypothetical protein
MLVNIAYAGYFIDILINKVFPNRNPVEIFTGFFFYFLVIDLLIRFAFIKIPVLSIQPYRTLPIKRITLFHYPLIKSLFSLYNLIPLLFIIPFFVKVICVYYPVYNSINWLIICICLLLINVFLNFSLKKFFLKRPFLILLILVILGTALYCDILGYISVSAPFSSAFLFFVETPGLVPILIATVGLAYFLGYSILKKGYYFEDNKKSRFHNTGNLSILARYGETGILLRNEIMLIIRNKRPRSMALFCTLVFAWACFLYTNKSIEHLQFMIICGFMVTTPFTFMYGQYTFSWEGCFFDCYLANNISVFNYLRAKYILFAMAGFLSFLLTLPFAIIHFKIILVNLIMLVYNIGITSVLMLFLCTFNSTRMDLGQSQFMNYQGMGVLQLVLVLPLFGIPAIFFVTAFLLSNFDILLYLFGISGIVGILMNKFLLRMVARQFARRKYIMARGFREI